MTETAVFAAGCFWGVESDMREIAGVLDVEAGYANGRVPGPVSYEDVCSGTTGYAEAVRVTFDPAAVSFEQLLEVFWACHNPTTANRQGPDVGTQYRSGIFSVCEAQQHTALASRTAAQARFTNRIATAIEPLTGFQRAEEYHQRYFEKQGVRF
jgi:peptide-methionine (S)-S-oxide reductase